LGIVEIDNVRVSDIAFVELPAGIEVIIRVWRRGRTVGGCGDRTIRGNSHYCRKQTCGHWVMEAMSVRRKMVIHSLARVLIRLAVI
jgi:hypothetical protein